MPDNGCTFFHYFSPFHIFALVEQILFISIVHLIAKKLIGSNSLSLHILSMTFFHSESNKQPKLFHTLNLSLFSEAVVSSSSDFVDSPHYTSPLLPLNSLPLHAPAVATTIPSTFFHDSTFPRMRLVARMIETRLKVLAIEYESEEKRSIAYPSRSTRRCSLGMKK